MFPYATGTLLNIPPVPVVSNGVDFKEIVNPSIYIGDTCESTEDNILALHPRSRCRCSLSDRPGRPFRVSDRNPHSGMGSLLFASWRRDLCNSEGS